MRVGFGKVDITPPVGTWMSGYGARGASEEVRDPLVMQAVAWTDEAGVSVVILAADLLGYDYEFVAGTRQALGQRFPVAPDAVLMNASHTHGGPAIINHLVTEAPHIDDEYRARVAEAALQATQQAFDSQQRCRIAQGWGRCRVGINRRPPAPPFSPMQPNPHGFYDDTVGVVAFHEADGPAPLGVLFNASCHPTTLGAVPRLSADWCGVARASLESTLGEGRAIFLQGACGNIRPRTFDLADPTRFRKGTEDEMDRMGGAVAHEVVRLLAEELIPVEGELSAGIQPCELPLDEQPAPDELRAMAESDEGAAYTRAWAQYLLARYPDGKLPATLPYEAQLIDVGDELSILALPGEVVSELGFEARTAVPRPALFCGYSNGLPCYVPNARIRRQGGYEAGQSSNQFFGMPGWLSEDSERVILRAVETLAGML